MSFMTSQYVCPTDLFDRTVGQFLKGLASVIVAKGGHINAGLTLLTGYNFLNWYLTLKEFSLFPLCNGILSWGRALGPLGGLSTGQLNCCLPRMEEKRRVDILNNVLIYVLGTVDML